MSIELKQAAQQALLALEKSQPDPSNPVIGLTKQDFIDHEETIRQLRTAIQQAEAKTDEMGTLFVKGALSGIVDAQVRDLWPTKSATHPAPGVPDAKLIERARKLGNGADPIAYREALSDIGRAILTAKEGANGKIN